MQNPNRDDVNYLPVEKLEALHAMTDDELRNCAKMNASRGNLGYADTICRQCGVVTCQPYGNAGVATIVECDACILQRVRG
jgi:hypothetical protein